MQKKLVTNIAFSFCFSLGVSVVFILIVSEFDHNRYDYVSAKTPYSDEIVDLIDIGKNGFSDEQYNRYVFIIDEHNKIIEEREKSYDKYVLVRMKHRWKRNLIFSLSMFLIVFVLSMVFSTKRNQ
jgi:hypothetical protein